MTPEYKAVLDHIEQKHAKTIEHHQKAMARTQNRAREQTELLSKVTLEFLTTGIIDLSSIDHMWDLDYHGVGFGHKGWRWARYFRDVAKEAGRPYVSVSKSRYGAYIGNSDRGQMYEPGNIYLFVTKRKYTSPLISMFMLLENCAQVSHDTRYWKVTLRGTDGQDAYAVWRNECASNPGYLKALRIIK